MMVSALSLLLCIIFCCVIDCHKLSVSEKGELLKFRNILKKVSFTDCVAIHGLRSKFEFLARHFDSSFCIQKLISEIDIPISMHMLKFSIQKASNSLSTPTQHNISQCSKSVSSAVDIIDLSIADSLGIEYMIISLNGWVLLDQDWILEPLWGYGLDDLVQIFVLALKDIPVCVNGISKTYSIRMLDVNCYRDIRGHGFNLNLIGLNMFVLSKSVRALIDKDMDIERAARMKEWLRYFDLITFKCTQISRAIVAIGEMAGDVMPNVKTLAPEWRSSGGYINNIGHELLQSTTELSVALLNDQRDRSILYSEVYQTITSSVNKIVEENIIFTRNSPWKYSI